MEIPDPLFKQAKIRAAKDGLKLKDLVASALSTYLSSPQSPTSSGPKPCPFPLARGKGGLLLRKVTNQLIADLEEEEDLERYRRAVRR